jgi:hypothetical protein
LHATVAKRNHCVHDSGLCRRSGALRDDTIVPVTPRNRAEHFYFLKPV